MKRKRALAYKPHATYFLTTTVTGFTHLLNREALAQIVVDNVAFYVRDFGVQLHGFVIMPNHLHLLVTMGQTGNVSQFMGRLKERSAKQIIDWCQEHDERTLLEIFSASARRYRHDHRYQVWQARFDDVVIATPEMFTTKLHYIHNNPVQEGWSLCSVPEEYQFSSARYYARGENVGVSITEEPGRHP